MATPHTKSYMPAWLPAFNKKVTNPLQGIWAPWLPPYMMVHHVGRKSGRRFKTPVMAFKRGGTLYVNLLYGSDSQWVKNVLAAGGAEVVRLGRRLEAREPLVVRRGDFDGPLPFQTKLFGDDLGILILTIS